MNANRLAFPIAVSLATMFLIAPPVRGQTDQMEQIERVAQLQRQLDADIVADREAAEKELISMGVMVLDNLEPPGDSFSTDALERLERVRSALEKVAIERVTQPSQVTLKGTVTLKDALAEILRQTENKVELPEGFPDDILQQELKLDQQQATFWEALTEIRKQTNLEVDPFGSTAGIMRLSPKRQTGGAPPPQAIIPTDSSGVFESSITQVSAFRNLTQPNLNGTTLTLRIRWEPRIAPISIALPTSSLELIDEFDRKIKVTNEQAVFSGTVQPEIPELEFNLPLELIDRQVENIKTLTAELKTVLPGRQERFKFKSLGRLGAGAKQTKAGVTVGFEGIRKNEDLFGVIVSVAFDDAKQGLESHLGWVYENKVYLVGEDDQPMLPLASESMGQTENETKIMYYFDQDPAKLSLVYETPAAIVAVPIKIKLTDIPLP